MQSLYSGINVLKIFCYFLYLIRRARDDQLSVFVHVHTEHSAVMTFQGMQQRAATNIPQFRLQRHIIISMG